MRGVRSTLALLAVLIGLGTYIYIDSKKPDDSATKDKMFPGLEAAKIEEMTVKSASGDVTTLKKEGGAWKLTSPIQVAASEVDASGIANALADITVARVVEEAAADLKTYGLEAPKLDIQFKSADGKTSGHVQVGDTTATGGNLYARKADEKRVVLIPQFHESGLNKSTFDLRDKAIVKFDRAKVDGIDTLVNGKEIEFTKVDTNWQMIKPLKARTDYSAAEGLVTQVETAQMKTIVGPATTPEDLKKYGFDKPTATVNLHLGSARATLIVGAKADDQTYYIRDASRPDVYTVENYPAEVFQKPAEDFRKKELFDFRAFDATRVEFTRGAETIVFERVKAKEENTPDSWHRVSPNPGDPDREKVQSLLASVADIRATSFVESRAKTGLDAPAMTVYAKFEDGKKEERVIFGKVGADVFAGRVDDPGASKVEAVKFDETMKSLDELSK